MTLWIPPTWAQLTEPEQEIIKGLCGPEAPKLGVEFTSLIPKIQKICPECTEETIKYLVQEYHPTLAGSISAARMLAGGHLPQASEIGSEEEWSDVRIGTPQLSKEVYGESRCAHPVARYHRGPYSLSYLVTRHESSLKTTEINAQRAFIENEFNTQKPETVLVEGYSQTIPCTDMATSMIHPSNEQQYSLKLSLLRQIPASGSDENDLTITHAIRNQLMLHRKALAVFEAEHLVNELPTFQDFFGNMKNDIKNCEEPSKPIPTVCPLH